MPSHFNWALPENGENFVKRSFMPYRLTPHEARSIRMIKPRRINWVGHVVSMGQNRYAYEISVGRTEGQRPLERLKRRWKYTKTDLKEAGWGSADCIRMVR
jgi:hypothetical protein